jgi:hypothetical protein
MTPKEKSRELVKKYENFTTIWIDEENFYKSPKLAKRGALIAVDEILEASLYQFDEMDKYVIYWQEVKQEIEKL